MTDRTDLPRTGIPEDLVPGGEPFEDYIVASVSPYTDDPGYSITTEDSTGFGMPQAPDRRPPEKGDRVRVWGAWGRRIHGIALRGKVVFYRTREEDEAKHEAEVEQSNAERKAHYEALEKDELQARYEKLPAAFKARIDKYREGPNSDFGWQFESYEMFCCEQAVAFAERARNAVALDDNADAEIHFAEDEDPPPTPELRWLVWWNALNSEEFDYDYARQKELMPALSDEHSGNTFGSACNLAILWLRPDAGEEAVVRRYGSLAPLVGSEAYGDPMEEEAA